ncbi:unnamed protein product [Microthlaspi erraticum]|uniref:Translin-associated protein X n=1 Tax=Microthlaspi erraticum TaxID=1685480 RepID=A0A6D2HP16_9BRAS|nr:unnamed protein product [Microthlaspi erraticum]
MAPKALSTPKFQGPRENRRSISSHSTSPLSSNAFPDQRSFREILTREHKENKRITTNRYDMWLKLGTCDHNFNEKRERVVKASRDITMNSKKKSHLSGSQTQQRQQRGGFGESRERFRSRERAKIFTANERASTNKFLEAETSFSPGVQEYFEAATFYKFCLSGTLSTLDEFNATLLPFSEPSMEPLQNNILDYILGLADFTGEVMRITIGRIADGEIELAERICQFVRQIYRELMLVVPKMDVSYDM